MAWYVVAPTYSLLQDGPPHSGSFYVAGMPSIPRGGSLLVLPTVHDVLAC